MLPSEWPEAVKFSDLCQTHPDYNPSIEGLSIGKRVAHDALYEGGDKFRKHIDSFLDKRSHEGGNGSISKNLKAAGEPTTGEHLYGVNGAAIFERRKRISRYTPIASGKIDWIIAATHQAPPRITATMRQQEGLENVNDDALAYWKALDGNADGHGGDLLQLTKQVLKNVILHRFAFLAVSFPKIQASSRGEQKKLGGLDVKLRAVDNEVDDWSFTPTGELEYVRTHIVESVKKYPWSASSGEKHTWTYFTADTEIEYTLVNKNSEKVPEFASRTNIRQHGFGRIPFFCVRIPAFLWLMERLRELIVKHFNRDAALTWSLNQMAFSILALIGQGEKPKINIDPETMALILSEGSAQFLSPDSQIWNALKGDLERVEKDIDSVIQAAALSAAKRDTQGRQSGVAKFREFGSLATLLNEYAVAVRNVLETAVKAVQEYRDDENIELIIEGLDKFDVQSLELKTTITKNALAMPVSAAYRKWAMTDLQLALAHNAPADVRQAIIQETSQDDVSPTNLPNVSAEIRDKKTESVVLDKPESKEV